MNFVMGQGSRNKAFCAGVGQFVRPQNGGVAENDTSKPEDCTGHERTDFTSSASLL